MLHHARVCVGAFLICVLISFAGALAQTGEDEWFDAHEVELRELVLPVRGASLDPKLYKAWVYVVFEASDSPTFLLRMKLRTNDEVESEMTVADPPLVVQAQSELRKKPDDTVESIASRIKLSTTRLNSSECPALKERFAELYDLRRPMLRQHHLILHPTSYRFVFQSNFDDVVDIDTSGPPELLSDGGDPLISWVRGARRTLDSCSQKAGEK